LGNRAKLLEGEVKFAARGDSNDVALDEIASDVDVEVIAFVIALGIAVASAEAGSGD
jgi:hypothetical protein